VAFGSWRRLAGFSLEGRAAVWAGTLLSESGYIVPAQPPRGGARLVVGLGRSFMSMATAFA
jgi:hypothetical protein